MHGEIKNPYLKPIRKKPSVAANNYIKPLKRGRPPVPETKKRSESITLRPTEQECAVLQAFAERIGSRASISMVARDLVVWGVANVALEEVLDHIDTQRVSSQGRMTFRVVPLVKRQLSSFTEKANKKGGFDCAIYVIHVAFALMNAAMKAKIAEMEKGAV